LSLGATADYLPEHHAIDFSFERRSNVVVTSSVHVEGGLASSSFEGQSFFCLFATAS
jgi:hypothetical protein